MLALAHAGAAGSPAAGGLNCPTLPIPTLLSSLAPNIRSLSGGHRLSRRHSASLRRKLVHIPAARSWEVWVRCIATLFSRLDYNEL